MWLSQKVGLMWVGVKLLNVEPAVTDLLYWHCTDKLQFSRNSSSIVNKTIYFSFCGWDLFVNIPVTLAVSNWIWSTLPLRSTILSTRGTWVRIKWDFLFSYTWSQISMTQSHNNLHLEAFSQIFLEQRKKNIMKYLIRQENPPSQFPWQRCQLFLARMRSHRIRENEIASKPLLICATGASWTRLAKASITAFQRCWQK